MTYPSPRRSMFGGRVDFVQTMYFSMGQISSRPSSSQSWSPLHTRDWLIHFPEGRHMSDCSSMLHNQWMSCRDLILTRSTTKPASTSIIKGAAFSCFTGLGFSSPSVARASPKLSIGSHDSTSCL